MKDMIFKTGAFVFTAILFAIPILWTCAWCLGWDDFIKWLLTIVIIGEYLTASALMVNWNE